jgi:hypothetical protein
VRLALRVEHRLEQIVERGWRSLSEAHSAFEIIE